MGVSDKARRSLAGRGGCRPSVGCCGGCGWVWSWGFPAPSAELLQWCYGPPTETISSQMEW